MQYVTLGRSDLRVSELGFGCCPMGGFGWGQIESRELVDAVNLALDRGVNFFDTADVYGLGESETTLGRALGTRRAQAVIATKFGVHAEKGQPTTYDNSAAWLNQALDASLKRLGTDYIDLYQVHYRDVKTPMPELVAALEEKRRQGKIRYYGLSNISKADLEFEAPGLVSFQMEYSLAKRTHEELIRFAAQKKGLGFLSWGSLGQGILSGKYTAATRFAPEDRRSRPAYVNFHGEKLKQNLLIVDEMRRISARIGKTLPEVAIRWILDHLGFGTVLVGIKRPEQLEQNAHAFGWKLDPADIRALEAISVNQPGQPEPSELKDGVDER